MASRAAIDRATGDLVDDHTLVHHLEDTGGKGFEGNRTFFEIMPDSAEDLYLLVGVGCFVVFSVLIRVVASEVRGV
jgi:hypothetical protein